MSQADYVDVDTVANAYNVSVATVRRWCRDGVIKDAIPAGRQWRIPARYSTGHVPIKLPGGESRGGKSDE